MCYDKGTHVLWTKVGRPYLATFVVCYNYITKIREAEIHVRLQMYMKKSKLVAQRFGVDLTLS